MENLLSFKCLPSKKKCTEQSLIKKSIEGDKYAFEEIIRNYKEYLYKIAFTYTKNEHDALDIYQETIFKAFLNINTLKNPKYFQTWITRILINTFNTNSKRNVEHFDIDDYTNKVSYEDYSDIESKIDLYDALDFLEDKYKIPIILQYFNGMSIKDISYILECNENTVKTNIRRGKERLCKIILEGR